MRARGLAVMTALLLGGPPAGASDRPGATVRVPAFALPFSPFASEAARQQFERQRAAVAPPLDADIAVQRAYYDRINRDRVDRMRRLYAVTIRRDRIGGIAVDRVTPTAGVADPGRILVNLHGGAFLWGAGSGGLVEAIPIAALGRVEVIAVDYRQGPEYRFPAASQDVAAVYRTLLATHRPDAIGLYGCSAGGVLAAQAVAWFQREALPRPGAIGTFCGAAVDMAGDSARLATAATGGSPDAPLSLRALPYLAQADAADPLVFPGLSPAILARFPPTLLITGTRDFAMSSVLHSNELLAAAGVPTELHVWEGMGHAFFSDPEPPESKAAYATIVRFFDRTLHRSLPRRRVRR